MVLLNFQVKCPENPETVEFLKKWIIQLKILKFLNYCQYYSCLKYLPGYLYWGKSDFLFFLLTVELYNYRYCIWNYMLFTAKFFTSSAIHPSRVLWRPCKEDCSATEHQSTSSTNSNHQTNCTDSVIDSSQPVCYLIIIIYVYYSYLRKGVGKWEKGD